MALRVPTQHTYYAARLQTTDRGAPVQQFTVMREMGRKDFQLINHED